MTLFPSFRQCTSVQTSTTNATLEESVRWTTGAQPGKVNIVAVATRSLSYSAARMSASARAPQKRHRFAPLGSVSSTDSPNGVMQLKGIVFDMDGTLVLVQLPTPDMSTAVNVLITSPRKRAAKLDVF